MKTENENTSDVLEQGIQIILRNLFGEFGPVFSVLTTMGVPILLSSIGLESFNPGVWFFGSVIAILLISLLKQYITYNKNRLIIIIISVLFILSITNGYIFAKIKYNPLLFWLSLSFLISSIIALILIANKNQHDGFDKPLPEILQKTLITQLYKNSFYKSNIVYDITLCNIEDEKLKINFKYSYNVYNRENEDAKWEIKIDPQGELFKPLELRINNEEKSVYSQEKDFDCRKREIIIPKNSYSSVFYEFEVKYPLTFFEYFTSYDMATDLSLTIDNQIPNLIEYNYEFYYDKNNKTNVKTKENPFRITIDQGLLPHQGIILSWNKK